MNIRCIPLLLALCLLLAACGSAPARPSAEVTPSAAPSCTFTDSLERTVAVENPRRFAALLGSYAQIIQLAGGYVCAAPDDAWEDLALDMPADAKNLGSTENLSLELLMASAPDLVIASVNRRQNIEWLDTLEQMGVPVAYFDISDFADYLALLEICTDLTGRADLFDTHGTAVQGQIDAVLARAEARLAGSEAPTVLSMTASASTIRAQNSKGTVLGAMLKSLGCENIADSDTSLLDNLSLEHILVSDPDYIFIVQRGDDEAGMRDCVRRLLEEHPAWSQLTAVKSGRVYFMEKALFNLKPNQRWGEAYEILEGILEHG